MLCDPGQTSGSAPGGRVPNAAQLSTRGGRIPQAERGRTPPITATAGSPAAKAQGVAAKAGPD